MTSSIPFYTADVFTSEMFGGNQLAVFPAGAGLDTRLMQAIAKELNLSETVFVFAPDDASHTRKLRIFTPGSELPFAGHPTLGAAFVLASIGEVALDRLPRPWTTSRRSSPCGQTRSEATASRHAPSRAASPSSSCPSVTRGRSPGPDPISRFGSDRSPAGGRPICTPLSRPRGATAWTSGPGCSRPRWASRRIRRPVQPPPRGGDGCGGDAGATAGLIAGFTPHSASV